MPTLQVDECIVPLIQRDIEFEKRKLSARIVSYEEEMRSLEERYGFSSEAFLQEFHSGELGDDSDWVRWEFLCETAKKLRLRSEALDRVVYEGC